MATTRQRGTIELRLVAVAPGGEAADLVVEAVPDAPARELVAAVAAELGLEEAQARVGGEQLPADAPLSELALRHGDVLDFSGRAPPAAGTERELVVAGGPEAGRRFPLAPGVHRVGREGAFALDDPSLSAAHVVLAVADDGAVTVADAGSRNGTAVEGVALEPGEERPLAEGELVAAGRTLFAVETPALSEPNIAAAGDGLVRFNRPPRVQRPLEESVRPFPAPPDRPQRARLPLAASLVPLALGVGLWLLTHLVTMMFFALLSPVMALTTYLEDRRSGRRGFDRHAREYRMKLARLRDELEEERREELARRRAAGPPAPELLRRAQRLEPSLWERRPDDHDFLSLRIGSADRPALLALRLNDGGAEELRREAEELGAWYATAPAVPVTVPVAELGVVGVCGPRARVEALARWLVAQAAALHSPRELALAAAVDSGDWEWMKWLPHMEARRLAADGQATRALLEELGRLVAARRADSEQTYGGAARRAGPHVLLVLDEAVAPERALVADVLAAAGELGISVLWLGRERRDLPGECAGILQLDPESARVSFTDARGGGAIEEVSADGISVELARGLALALAPVRDADARRSEGVPHGVTLLDLLGCEEPDGEWVRGRWDAGRGRGRRRGRRRAAVGRSAQGRAARTRRGDDRRRQVGAVADADRRARRVAPPNRLTFLLVDYKGGAAFKDCVRLPHTVGLVTDLDAHLTQRALASLNAELQRRERILREAGAKDLADMESHDGDGAPPSLLIVIDEFATLAKEVPDFVDGVVDVAQRGRSLGVHLLLATQRPGGVVSENIRANTNLRIALRVNEAAESSDVIGAPDAVRIPRDRPGRAFARTGHGELTEFQTAYAGGVTKRVTLDAPVVVRRFALGAVARDAAAEAAGETDLARLVEAAVDAAARRGIEPPSSPWLPALEPVLPLAALPEPGDGAVAVGLVDEPQRQAQRPLAIDLEREGSVLVYGASGAGKTTFLRALALALAEHESPDELHVYALDFATRGLAPLAALPHVGAVIGGEDEERTERLFAFLRRTLERRKQQFAEAGAFTLSEFNARSREPLPRIVVLLDGYAGFASAFERVNLGVLVDALPRLVADGRPLGVHFAVTADRRGAVPNALAGIVPTKIVVRMADDDELAALGVPPKAARGAQLPPGRGFLPGGTELQVAADGDLAERAAGLRARHGVSHAPSVEPLPTALARSSLPAPQREWTAVLGLADAELEPVDVSLADRHFLVVGPYRSGRSTALRTGVESLRASTPGLELHLLAPRRSPLAELRGWASVATADECDDAALRLAEAVASRPDRPMLVVIDDGEELAESLGAPSLETVVRRARDLPIRVVAAVERQAAQRAFGGWLRELRKEEHGLLLDPDPDVDGEILGTRLPRRSNPVFPPGRGYLVERGLVELVQVARS